MAQQSGPYQPIPQQPALYLPAPYESAPRDDLGAALGAGLTVSLAGISSWILGHRAYLDIRGLIHALRGGDRVSDLPAGVAVPAVGWAVAAFFLGLGALLLLFRRGRETVIIGALFAIGTTAVAQLAYHFGSATVAQWPLYWGGVVVLVAAVLPATGRWVASPGPDGTGSRSG